MSINLPHRRALLGGAAPFSISDLFANGTYAGFDFTDLATLSRLFTTSAGSTNVASSGDPVGQFIDKSPSVNTATQGTSGSRPTWQANSGKPYLSFDGVDDNLLSGLAPAAEMTLAACFRAGGSNQFIIGGGATTGSHRCVLGTASTGSRIGGMWGADSNATIAAAAGSIVNTDVVGLLRGNASNVNLWLNGALVYAGAASGTPAGSTGAFALGAYNNNGSPGSYVAGRAYRAIAVQRYIPDSMVLPLMRALGAGIVTF